MEDTKCYACQGFGHFARDCPENGGDGGNGGGRGSGGDVPDTTPYKSDDIGQDDQVALKIRGMPYRTRKDEIVDFFKDYAIIEESIIFGMGSDGRKNGFGAVVFKTEDDAKNAQQALERQNIGERYVNLYVISYNNYLNFNAGSTGRTGGGGGGGGDRGSSGNGDEFVKLSQFVNDGNKDKSLVMRGLPWRVTNDEIISFFDGYGTISEDNIHLEIRFGKRTGAGVVIFENEEHAQNAKDAMNKQVIGSSGRYVDLFDSNDDFMMKVCNLYD